MAKTQTSHKEEQAFTSKIMDLMKKSPTSFHVCKNNVEVLEENGFVELPENEEWVVKPGGKYYVTRNNSAVIALKIPKKDKFNGFMIGASHSDHPCFKVINNCEVNSEDHYKLITIEAYPKTIDYTWFDVPLSVAGRLIVKTNDGFETKLVNIDRPLLMIPSLSSHMQKEYEHVEDLFDLETRMRPIFTTDSSKTLMDVVLGENNIDPKKIIDSELFVYRQSEPIVWGANNEFMSSRAIDDQISVYCSLMALIDAEVTDSIAIHAVFDNEEIGSWTMQGADSTFLSHVMLRVLSSMKLAKSDFRAMLPNSYALSIDNAHGLHPNYPDKFNKIAKTFLGKGAVLKKAASYSYCTNAVSSSLLHRMADKEGAKLQDFFNRPGVIPGSTLARFMLPYTSVIGADVGIAQFAMHSGYETCSAYDALHLKKVIQSVYSSTLIMRGDGNYTVK